jgi:hypothetical protein
MLLLVVTIIFIIREVYSFLVKGKPFTHHVVMKILGMVILWVIVLYIKILIIKIFNLYSYRLEDFLPLFMSATIIHIYADIYDYYSMPLGPGGIDISNPENVTSSNSTNNNNSGSINNNINTPDVPSDNNANETTSNHSSDTDWSGGNPMSPGGLDEYSRRIINEVASSNPAHTINDPNFVTEGGYRGGGNISDAESNHSNDSALGETAIRTIQPFATNLANYLENYKRDANSVYGTGGFPRLDERSLNWYIGYLNTNFPSHYGAERLHPTSSRVIQALREAR